MNHSNETIVREAVALDVPDSDSLRFLPEGPIPLTKDGYLSWVGIQHGSSAKHGSINLLDLNTNENRSFDLPGRPGFAFACDGVDNDGLPTRFVAGVERELGIFDLTDRSWKPFQSDVDSAVTNTIINDGLVYEDNLIFGTKDLAFAEKKAGLYLYRGQDQKLIALRNDQVCSNGKMIRVDDSGRLKLVDIDSPTRLIVEYDLDIDAGTIGEARVLVDLTSDPGVPDGAVLTPEGDGIIVSIFLPTVADHGETRLYDLATGNLRCVWRTPGSPQNTCPALVAKSGRVHLVITTAVENMSAEDQEKCPNAGRLFVGETNFEDASKIVPSVYRAR
ncbi:SMP-30/gluconolactonase/LRE family protein [Neorhodopirellula pilleata]|uniref:SMP-30/Gluconolaconase/LRE-like region n=1 Tax=Neorhodopirellula pilleata TaxID=2714738 RepID=A0A5C6ADY8_9BACT|nr:SMP-30/gluconolactonase/LRE family protein [Neorhodopirellula pilleata]TWT97528.1 SMP-30/Gluconolaconase/LRE-like region [Neorhodopirellula pilleata]